MTDFTIRPGVQQGQAPAGHGWVSRLFLPGTSVALCLFGYYALAVPLNILETVGREVGIAIRLFLVAVPAICFLRCVDGESRYYIGAVTAYILFSVIWMLRWAENSFFHGIEMPPDNTTTLLVFLTQSFLVTIFIVLLIGKVRIRDFVFASNVLCLTFAAGLLLNLDQLVAGVETRMVLDRINPISLGYTAATMVAYLAAFWRHSNFQKVLALILIPAFMAVVILTQSRGVWLSSLAGIAFLALFAGGRVRLAFIVAGALISIGLAFFLNEALLGVLERRLTNSNVYADQAVLLRVMAANGSWTQFLSDPFFGRYIIEISTNFYPHNIILESLMAVGLIGSVPLFIFLWQALSASVGLVRRFKTDPFVLLLVFLFIQAFVIALSSGALFGSGSVWVGASMVIGMALLVRRQALARGRAR